MVRDPSPFESEPDAEMVLDTLGDDTVRTILESLTEPMTASELSEACDVPLSTMYRKLDQLEEASLVEEMTEIRTDGQHTTRYARNFVAVMVDLDEDERLAATIDRPEEAITADRRLEELWSQLKEET